jgi:hypothetical protein
VTVFAWSTLADGLIWSLQAIRWAPCRRPPARLPDRSDDLVFDFQRVSLCPYFLSVLLITFNILNDILLPYFLKGQYYLSKVGI